MFSNIPTSLMNDDFQAKHNDILAAARVGELVDVAAHKAEREKAKVMAADAKIYTSAPIVAPPEEDAYYLAKRRELQRVPDGMRKANILASRATE